MLKRFNIKVKTELEEPLLGLADRLGMSAFSNPCIIDEGFGETDYAFTGETVVSFIASTVEQDIKFIADEINSWLDIFEVSHDSLTLEEYQDDQDWMAGFREYFKPVIIGEKIVVRPPWEEQPVTKHDAVTILIDPGMAFGTGTHETTRLCLELLKDIDVKGKVFYDAGAGSGILSFYMLKAGADRGVAIEIEGAAVENMRKNFKLNKLEDNLKMLCCPLSGFKPTEKADVLLANITSPVIIDNIRLLSTWVKPSGIAMFSGVNSANAPLVKEHFAKHNWKVVNEITEDDWHGFHLKKL